MACHIFHLEMNVVAGPPTEEAVCLADNPDQRCGSCFRSTLPPKERRVDGRDPSKHAPTGSAVLDVEQFGAAPVSQRENLGHLCGHVVGNASPLKRLVRKRCRVEPRQLSTAADVKVEAARLMRECNRWVRGAVV